MDRENRHLDTLTVTFSDGTVATYNGNFYVFVPALHPIAPSQMVESFRVSSVPLDVSLEFESAVVSAFAKFSTALELV